MTQRVGYNAATPAGVKALERVRGPHDRHRADQCLQPASQQVPGASGATKP
jgi:hypothetical protein